MLKDTALIVVSAVLANEMGLVGAIEDLIHHRFRILSCPKCLTFWSVLIYNLLCVRNALLTIAVSFCASYVSLWICCLYDWAAKTYNGLYDKIYQETPEADSDNQDESSADGVSSM